MKNRRLAAPYLLWMTLFTVIPIFVVVYFAFSDSITGGFSLENFAALGSYSHIMAKSIYLALISAFVCLIIGYPAAYYIASLPPKAQRWLYLLIMLPMCMSFLLKTLSWVSLLEDTGIINSLLGKLGVEPLPLIRNNGAVVLGIVYNFLPYMIMPLFSVLEKMDKRLLEAAADLGCSPLQVFTKVILPLSVPGIVSGLTMVFVPAVSTFYISRKLGSPGTVLMGDVIETQFKTAYNPNLGAALSLLLMVIVLFCIFLMNKFSGSYKEEVTI